MSKITRFEDLECWQSARQLVKKVYLVSMKGPLGHDYDTKSQLRKAGLSSMNNIAEGFSRFNKKDSVKFYDYAQSSVAEVRSMLYVFEDLEYLSKNDLDDLFKKTEKTQKLILGFIRYVNKR
ncbi:MAG: four helix bundle protein [Bacteroidales bacterium]|nr:four helix bundle protein [Bacteroidales bacterium]